MGQSNEEMYEQEAAAAAPQVPPKP